MTIKDASTLLQRLTLLKVGIFFLLWIGLFAAAYASLPADSFAENGIQSFPDAWYFSVVTATTLGYGDIKPLGWARLLSQIEVIGGLILGGLAVATVAAMPLRRQRLALSECAGWWLERIEFVDEKRSSYCLTRIVEDDNSLFIQGENYDPDRPNDKTSYTGYLLANAFPLVVFTYKNDVVSTDFTEGLYLLSMLRGHDGHYQEYRGECYDRKYGNRDQVRGYKVKEKSVLAKLDDPRTRRQEIARLIQELFVS